MKASLLLRIICLLGVIVSGVFYFNVRSQKIRIENNLNQSRQALQQKLKESASLKSRVLHAEESSKQMTQLAVEEKSKASSYKTEFDDLNKKTEKAQAARKRSEEEVTKLSAANRNLQREVNNLKAAVPPQNWRQQLNLLQSRHLDLEAENVSLKKSLAATGRPQTGLRSGAAPGNSPQTLVLQPVGEVIRIGPDGSFAIISYGRQLGAAEGQTLSIHRGQQKVGLISITQITNDFSIAQILSSTNTGSSLSVPDIQIGDTAHLE